MMNREEKNERQILTSDRPFLEIQLENYPSGNEDTRHFFFFSNLKEEEKQTLREEEWRLV